jgi:hypothetical protein
MLSWIICPRISLSGCGRANAGPVKSKRERTFRERAYLLGQEAGCPDNQADGFRHRACEIERKSTDWTLLHATGQLPPIRALREGDVLVIWKLDRLGRTLAHLVNTVQSFQTTQRIEGTDRHDDVRGRMIFGIFMTPAEFERDLIRALTKAKVRLAQVPWSSVISRSQAYAVNLQFSVSPSTATSAPTACSGATAKKFWA